MTPTLTSRSSVRTTPPARLRRRAGSAVVAGLLATTLVACSGPEAEPEPSSPAPSSPGETTAASPAAEAVEIPETSVGEQVRWVIGAIDPTVTREQGQVAEEAAVRLSPTALESISAEDLADVLGQLAGSGPWRAVAYDGTESEAMATIESHGGDRLDLAVSLGEGDLIEVLLFTPPFEHEAATSWEELEEAVAALPAPTTLVVTDVTDTASPQEVFAAGTPEEAGPIGSVFKLYVLGAVVEAVADGTITWEDRLTVTDELRSLPSGELQKEPAGTEVTVREAAQAMIEISDNTATDLLIDKVGRDAVEAQLVTMGHSDPALNTPFLTTRELFWLGWGDDGAYRERWRDGDEAARRALLAELPAGPPEITGALTDVVWADGLDWFATPADIVAAHSALAELATTPAGEPLAEILGANPGLAPDQVSQFETIAFKGGSSIGELALSWRVTTPEGAWVVVLEASSPEAAATMDVRVYAAAAGDAFALLTPAGE